MPSKKITIIGAGKMGEAIIAGLLNSGAYTPQDMQIVEVLADRRDHIMKKYTVAAATNLDDAVRFGDLIIVAVKPNIVGEVAAQLSPMITPEKIVISIAAGVTIKQIRTHIPQNIAVIRVMPNLACSVNEAMIAACSSVNTTIEEMNTATAVLSLLGKVVQLEEQYLNLATGLVGSGPAYLFVIIDALADAGVRLGLPKDLSILLAAQTTLGAAKIVVETGDHPAKLKDMVATPGGTTVEGLLALEQGKLRATLISAVTEATRRAKGLGS
ncbi:MAG: pyrroline-5-carboxylate reductase [Candidatus Bathyarchaeota archaeon]|nr:pyrroline-5-carboxylate reductase [Candidatus Bathyarchaeota archaeon]